ncbi:H-NS family nucleoid-associated regulatory protein [Pseudidiomarina taiwanensis]|uniref:DNA-binding protein n=1 Tax=Pseudidiomarina taiwanensis TaxID=337250 RepID=A0A432ZNS0_9GAMM|nr:H-NS family nucleoid-associated regulatory protein [Pseudidiomarina taiwanensis]RUO79523.1 histone [Pseudidiomarina taiwanensis]
MTDILKILTHGRRLKAAVKELSIEEIIAVKEKLEKVIEDRKVEEAEARAAEAQRQAKIQELREAMAAAGIALDDLADGSVKTAKPKRKRAPKPAKYAFTDPSSGERLTWTGQGRMPKVLKNRLDAGAKLDDFLI